MLHYSNTLLQIGKFSTPIFMGLRKVVNTSKVRKCGRSWPPSYARRARKHRICKTVH